jgi:hypothetical protein
MEAVDQCINYIPDIEIIYMQVYNYLTHHNFVQVLPGKVSCWTQIIEVEGWVDEQWDTKLWTCLGIYTDSKTT